MSRTLCQCCHKRRFHIKFDNLFSSVTLVEELAAKGLACTGTIRANRTSDCPLIDIKHIEKQPRGTYDHKCDNSRGVVMARWNDSSVVTVSSNFYGVEPIQSASRWSQKEGKRINIPQPYAIKQYNQTTGDVDRLDQNVEDYRKWDLIQEMVAAIDAVLSGRHSSAGMASLSHLARKLVLSQGPSLCQERNS